MNVNGVGTNGLREGARSLKRVQSAILEYGINQERINKMNDKPEYSELKLILESMKTLVDRLEKIIPTENDKTETVEFNEKNNTVLDYIYKWCMRGSKDNISRRATGKRLYNNYKTFCLLSGKKPVTKRTFLIIIRSIFGNEIKSGNLREFRGISIPKNVGIS